MADANVTQDLVRSLFEYRDGNLYWKVRPSNNRKVGSLAGNLHRRGWIQVYFGGKNHYAHRIIYLHQIGTLPDLLDHIDGNRANNRIENLRPATNSENLANRCAPKNNTSGYKGVWVDARRKTNSYQARCGNKYIGSFKTAEDAAKAHNIAALERYGQYALLNPV